MKVKHLRKLTLGIAVLCLSILAIPAGAEVSVRVGIQLPSIVFSSPPETVVLPGTYVYAVPDIDQDLYFYDGYWWRPYNGHWYRSRYYDRGWSSYSSAPGFYRQVPQDWRQNYNKHEWQGQPWQYQRIPNQQVQKNWNGWKKNNYWEKNQTWGVQGYNNHPQNHGQQPQAHQEPNRNQVHQSQGNQGHDQGNQGHGQGNQGHGQGNNGHGNGHK
jgi:hypothetical protein